jgi:hypothetical protein
MRMNFFWVGLVSLTAVVQAATIVKWGESGGDTGILTAGGTTGQNTFPTTYNPRTLVNPADGRNGYDVNAAGQTRRFSGAFSSASTIPVFADNAAGDYMQLLNNFGRGVPGTIVSMLAWHSREFLLRDGTLESFQVEFRTRASGDASAVSFLLQTSSGWYVSQVVATSSINGDENYVQVNEHIADLTWTGFSQFGVRAGTGIADPSDIRSVGILSSTDSTSDFAGNFIRHFEVTGSGGGSVNQPATLGLITSFGVGVLFIRRRIRRSYNPAGSGC